MLFVGNRFGGDAKDFCEQLMMVADALVHPVNLLGWIDESVRRTGCLSTGRLVRILAPKVAAAVGTFPPCEVLFCKEWNREFFWVDLRHLPSPLNVPGAE